MHLNKCINLNTFVLIYLCLPLDHRILGFVMDPEGVTGPMNLKEKNEMSNFP